MEPSVIAPKVLCLFLFIDNNDNFNNNDSSDEEMEDYYENHKEWPSIAR